MKFNTTKDIEHFLDRTPKFQSSGPLAAKFDLERFRGFCRAIGDPQDRFDSIHVGGTNGKGSTCQILASIYRQAGYRTALYTSPHLVNFRERFMIDGRWIGEEELLEFFREYGETLTEFELSYFEISTAIAFWWFAERSVDLALVEVGLGGRLDATNIIKPLLTVITNISLDHTDILGDTVREIAREKAGIIKKDIPVVLGNITGEAREEIEEIAGLRQCSVTDIEELHPRWEGGSCRLTVGGTDTVLKTDLVHPVHAFNIAVARRVVTALQKKYPVDDSTFEEGLKSVRTSFGHPGRFEKLHPELDWYFDGAHNPVAVKAMVEAASQWKSPGGITLVLAMMKDKLNREVANEFQKFKKIYYYDLGTERAASVDEVRQWLPNATSICDENVEEGPFLKELESELVIFAGSFYFYPTVRKWLQSSTVVR